MSHQYSLKLYAIRIDILLATWTDTGQSGQQCIPKHGFHSRDQQAHCQRTRRTCCRSTSRAPGQARVPSTIQTTQRLPKRMGTSTTTSTTPLRWHPRSCGRGSLASMNGPREKSWIPRSQSRLRTWRRWTFCQHNFSRRVPSQPTRSQRQPALSLRVRLLQLRPCSSKHKLSWPMWHHPWKPP